MAAMFSNQAFCAVSLGIYIFLNRPSHSMLLVCMKIWSISLQSLYARNYPSHLYNLCHYALRLKNEDSMHNSCIKIFCALPAATVTSNNGVSISSSLKQLGLGNCFAATNSIPSKTGCRHGLSPAALKHNSNIHGVAFYILQSLIWTLHLFELQIILQYLSLLFQVCVLCRLFLP